MLSHHQCGCLSLTLYCDYSLADLQVLLAAMSPDDRAAALATMSPKERAAAETQTAEITPELAKQDSLEEVTQTSLKVDWKVCSVHDAIVHGLPV